MLKVTAMLHHWLCANGIDPEGVRLTISFPDRRKAEVAQLVVQQEVKDFCRYTIESQFEGPPATMNGIGLLLSARS